MKKSKQEILRVSHFDFNIKELKSYYKNHLETLRLKYTYITWLFQFFKNKNEDIPDLTIIDREKVKMANKRGYTGDRCTGCGSYTMLKNGSMLKCTTCKDSIPEKYLLSDLLSVWDWIDKESFRLKRKIKQDDPDFSEDIKLIKIVEINSFQQYSIKSNIRIYNEEEIISNNKYKPIRCLVEKKTFVEAFLKLEKDWGTYLIKFQDRNELEYLIDTNFEFLNNNHENEFKKQLPGANIDYKKMKWIGKRGNLRLLAFFIEALVSKNILDIELHNILNSILSHFCKNTGKGFGTYLTSEALDRYNENTVRGREYVKSFINYIKPGTYL